MNPAISRSLGSRVRPHELDGIGERVARVEAVVEAIELGPRRPACECWRGGWLPACGLLRTFPLRMPLGTSHVHCTASERRDRLAGLAQRALGGGDSSAAPGTRPARSRARRDRRSLRGGRRCTRRRARCRRPRAPGRRTRPRLPRVPHVVGEQHATALHQVLVERPERRRLALLARTARTSTAGCVRLRRLSSRPAIVCASSAPPVAGPATTSVGRRRSRRARHRAGPARAARSSTDSGTAGAGSGRRGPW